jgi:ProP effector
MPQKNSVTTPSPIVILRKKRPSPDAASQAAASQAPQPPPPRKDNDSAQPTRARPALAKTSSVQRPAPAAKRATSSPPQPSAAATLRHTASSPSVSPPVEKTGQPNRRQRDAQAQRDLLATLRSRWPHVFPSDVRAMKPLAIGIHREIAAQLPGSPFWLIKCTIARFQRSAGGAYWQAVRQGGARYDLDGQPRGAVTLEEQEKAQQILNDLRAKKKQRRSEAPPAHTAAKATDAPTEA